MPELNPELNKEEVKPEYNETTAILKKDLIIALIKIKDQDSPAMLFNIHGREEMIMAKGEIDAFLTMKLIQGDMRAEQARNKIVPAKGGMMNFVRNRIK